MILTVTLNPCLSRTLTLLEEPEDNGTVRVPAAVLSVGGKGLNVARLLHKFDYDVTALTFIGGTTGDELFSQAQTDGIPLVSVEVASLTRTSTTVYNSVSKRYVEYLEPSGTILPEEKEQLRATYMELLPKSDLVILAGSSPCAKTDLLFAEFVALAREKNVRCFLDTYGAALVPALNERPFLVKNNLSEHASALNKNLNNDSAVKKHIRELWNSGIEVRLFTKGAPLFYTGWGERLFAAVPPDVEVVCPVGSGDAMSAGLAVGLLEQMTPEDTLRFAVACGAANAARLEICAFSRIEAEYLLDKVSVYEI